MHGAFCAIAERPVCCVWHARADELKRRRDFVAGHHRDGGGSGDDDVTMTSSRQVLLPGDMAAMTSLCADQDDVSICLQLVGRPR